MNRVRPLKNVQEIMKDKGFTLTALSFHSGIDLARLSRITNGWVLPSERDRQRISDALGVSPRVLFPEISGN